MKDKFEKIKYFLLLMLMGACLAGCGSAQEYISEQLDRAIEDKGQSVSDDAAGLLPSAVDIVVHISGAVVHPGVYTLPEGSRLCDAVDLAGGFTDEADESYLNLAEVIGDGIRYHVPTEEETAGIYSAPYAEPQDGKIDINHAGMEELMKLNGIGEGKARAIIAYREEHGAFASAEDIMKVSGIGEGTYQKFKDDITAR